MFDGSLLMTGFPSRVVVIGGLAVSTLGGWYHNAVDFPGMPLYAPEMLATIVPPLVLAVWWWWRPGRLPLVAVALWVLLSLFVGGLFSVLPLAVWPFQPAQTAAHYQAHLFYTTTQVPLLVIVVWMTGHFSTTDSGAGHTGS